MEDTKLQLLDSIGIVDDRDTYVDLSLTDLRKIRDHGCYSCNFNSDGSGCAFDEEATENIGDPRDYPEICPFYDTMEKILRSLMRYNLIVASASTGNIDFRTQLRRGIEITKNRIERLEGGG